MGFNRRSAVFAGDQAFDFKFLMRAAHSFFGFGCSSKWYGHSFSPYVGLLIIIYYLCKSIGKGEILSLF
jgi:hypothetical protein